MTHTNAWYHVAERLGLGTLGSILVVLPALLNWWEAKIVNGPPVIDYVNWGTLAVFIIAWVMGIYMTAREPEQHLWGCFFKAVGIPGTVMAAGKIFQLPT